MRTRGDSRSLIEKCVYLTLLITVIVADDEACDKTKCPGPLSYYKHLGCTPIYKNPNDCCAMEYDCDHLNTLSKDKCYANGHEYNIGEALREEDANPCDIGCTCRQSHENVAKFVCAIVDCFNVPSPGNCYMKNSPSKCCAGPEVCLEEGEVGPTCEVDGVTYKDGEFFRPKSDPEKQCYCMEGYKGENVEPFCKKPSRSYCDPIFYNPHNLHFNCTPVYYDAQSPQTDCSIDSRCQNEKDTVIHNHGNSKSALSEITGSTKTCQFGDIVMHVGDELNQGTDYSSVCVKCLCEIPPIPTCQRLPDAECDVTKHDRFD